MARPKTYHRDEDRLRAIKLNKKRWRERNRAIQNKRDAERQKNKRAARAIREGRTPGKTGNWRRFTKEQLRQKRKEYVENNRDIIRAHVRLRSARRKAAKVGATGKHSVADIRLLWELQKGNCVICLFPLVKGKFHVDHHVPLALGGSNDRANLRLTHKHCNLAKGARDPAEHALRNGLLCW